MASNVGALTNKRKQNLTDSRKGRNSMQRSGLKPSGPSYAGYGLEGSFMGSPTESWISLVGGGALAAFGVLELLNRRSKLVSGLVALVGGGLLYRGISGLLSPSDDMTESETGMRNPAASLQHLEGIKIEESIVVNRAAHDLYDFWRDFSNLPQIMQNLEEVEVIDENRSHWIAKAPLGTSVEWDAEVYIEKVGEMISWRSVEDSQIETAGSVHFDEEGPGVTRITVNMKVDVPAGALGEAVAKLFGDDPKSEIREDLKNFKKMMESDMAESSSTSSDRNSSSIGGSFVSQSGISTGYTGNGHSSNGHSSNGFSSNGSNGQTSKGQSENRSDSDSRM